MVEDRDGSAADAGRKRRERMARRSREQHSAASEIGDLPAIINPKRRESCRTDLVLFLTTYFPQTTGLTPFSGDHIGAIKRLQSAIINGGRFVNCVYRGFAKTTITENAAIWAIAYGHREYVALFGADQSAAQRMVESIKYELLDNDLLFEDFPEMCAPIKHMGGKHQAAASQTHQGQKTYISWLADRIVLAKIPDAPCSGRITSCHGLTAASRGLKHKRSDGTQVRPDFAILDDPQTDESAASPQQVKTRLGLLSKNIMRMAGNRKTMSCVVNGTKIQSSDMIDQLLDTKKYPAWDGERIPMVKTMPTNLESWWLTKYAEVRHTFDRSTPGSQSRAIVAANEFYASNRELADAGCVISWESCFDPETEVSAIQHAINILIDEGEETFLAECQQTPVDKRASAGAVWKPTLDSLEIKINHHERYLVPDNCTSVVAFVDVQKPILPYVVAAFDEKFSGAIIDYGCYPDQKKSYWTKRTIKRTLGHAAPGAGLEGSIYQGLNALIDRMCEREWGRVDGTILRMGLVLVDCGWGEMTSTVFSVCRDSKHGSIVRPSKGIGITADRKPILKGFYKPKPGERLGHNWVLTQGMKRRELLQVHFDSNYWKSFAMDRFAASPGDRGSLMLFGNSSLEHQLLIDHLSAEYPTEIQGPERRATIWKTQPSKPDNDLFDGVSGVCLAASILGSSINGEVSAPKPPKQRVSFSELQKAARRTRQ